MLTPISIRNIRLFYITQFLHALIFTIPIWIVYYQARISVAQISLLVAIQYFTQVISELPTGAVADMLGKRISIIIGFICAALSYFLFPLATEFSHFVVFVILVGLSDSFLSGSTEAMVYDSLKQDSKEGEFAKVAAKNGFIYQIGLIVGTVFGGLIYQQYIFAPYLLYALSLTVATILSFFIIEPKVDTEIFTLRNYFNQIKLGIKEAFKNKHAQLISLFYIAVGGITWTSTLYFNGFMLVDLGFSDTARGLIAGTLRLLNITVITQLLKNNHIFNRNASLLFFPITMIIAYIPGVLLQGIGGIPFVALAMMAGTARWIILGQYTNEAFSSKYRATAISTLSMLIGVFYITITAASGPIMELFGGVRTIYTLLGMITLFTVLPLSIMLVKNPINE